MDPLMLAIQCMFPVLDSQMLDPQELAIQPREQKEAIWGDSIGGRQDVGPPVERGSSLTLANVSESTKGVRPPPAYIIQPCLRGRVAVSDLTMFS